MQVGGFLPGIEPPADTFDLVAGSRPERLIEVVGGRRHHRNIGKIIGRVAPDKPKNMRGLIGRIGEGAHDTARHGDGIERVQQDLVLAVIPPVDPELAGQAREAFQRVVVGVQVGPLIGGAFDDGGHQALIIGNPRICRERSAQCG